MTFGVQPLELVAKGVFDRLVGEIASHDEHEHPHLDDELLRVATAPTVSNSLPLHLHQPANHQPSTIYSGIKDVLVLRRPISRSENLLFQELLSKLKLN